jgi:hypothetical protein
MPCRTHARFGATGPSESRPSQLSSGVEQCYMVGGQKTRSNMVTGGSNMVHTPLAAEPESSRIVIGGGRSGTFAAFVSPVHDVPAPPHPRRVSYGADQEHDWRSSVPCDYLAHPCAPSPTSSERERAGDVVRRYQPTSGFAPDGQRALNASAPPRPLGSRRR